MAEVRITEDTFTLPDGASVYRKTWKPSGAPKAILIHVHGFSDHINRYYQLFSTLSSRGILCTGIDQRGWGRSVKKDSDKGNTGPTAIILSDLASLFKSYLSLKTPVFVMGHSMGGAELLTMASTPEYKDLVSQFSGFIKLHLSKFVGRFFPKSQLVNTLPPDCVVTDPARQKDLIDDPLCNATGTLEMFANMLDRAANLVSGKLVLNKGVKALWLAHGTDDQVKSFDASREWYDREGKKVEDREFKAYEGWSHELHCDTPENGLIFANDVGDWILKRGNHVQGVHAGVANYSSNNDKVHFQTDLEFLLT